MKDKELRKALFKGDVLDDFEGKKMGVSYLLEELIDLARTSSWLSLSRMPKDIEELDRRVKELEEKLDGQRKE